MYRLGDRATYAATDLSSHSECEHRSELELGVLFGKLERPGQNELDRRMLEQRGIQHEERVLEHYRSSGQEVETIRAGVGEAERVKAAVATRDAMDRGVPVIYQGVLRCGDWFGRPDFLVRAEGESDLGAFRYEPVDAKLARETKARAVLQLCVYADLLEQVQGRVPERIWVVPGGVPRPEALRFADFGAHYRRVKAQFVEFMDAEAASRPYPEPVEHCNVCPWWKRCEDRRRADDHPSLIAGVTRRHRERFADEDLKTLAAIGQLREEAVVPGIRSESLGRIRHQASVQLAGREQGRPVHERLRPDEPTGLVLLPDPAPGDLFLDLEGDAFVGGEGLEYLFGLYAPQIVEDYFGPPEVVAQERYQAFWATNRSEERRAFEAVVDAIVAQRKRYASLHVYHFGHRENTALKNLAARHGTRADEIDTFLREGVLVDLHRVTRQGIRASVESYTLKELERFHAFERKTPVRDAAHAMQHFGWWLETGEASHSPDDLRATIQRYNEEDCRSTASLRDWLWHERTELRKEMGRSFPQQVPSEPKKASEKRAELLAQTAALQTRLRAGLPESVAQDAPEDAAKRLLADLLEWHAREMKPAWWEYFRTLDLPADEHYEDRAVLGELRLVRTRPSETHPKSVVAEYEFPPQEHGIKLGKSAIDPATQASAGTVEAVGIDFIHLRRGRTKEKKPPRALVPPGPLETAQQEASLRRLAEWVVDHDLTAPGPFRAARDLLLRRPPRAGAAAGAPLVHDREDAGAAIRRLALALDASTLAVQGPPGSGKTTAAAAMIVALLREGRRVGVTANSHKVILNLMRKARDEAARSGLELRCLHIAEDGNYGAEEVDFDLSKDYAKIADRLTSHELHLVGGTAWAWSREDLAGKLDVLVVDEAGQLSLANVLAMSPAATNLVLFGDPAQLEQPQKGVHPPGSECSPLEHLLGSAATMPPELGVFMPHTRRLHPDICRFTSAVFYDGRLEAEDALATQRVLCDGLLAGSGLRYVPVVHRGNTNYSDEEIERIDALVQELFGGGPKFVDRDGVVRDMTADDVLIVAPYNVQVEKLQRRLPAYRHRIGTVDKFQGQEAPVVIYSMTTSSAEDAPRGMEFLFSLNRLNVATSRAKAVVVVVGNPELGRARCRTVRQMKLANGVCAYLEMCR